MSISQEMAKIIKSLSKNQSKPINQMLEACELNRNFIYDLERRGSMPSVDKLIRIAAYLGVSTDYLLGIENEVVSSELAPDEQQLLSDYRSLSTQGKEQVRLHMVMALKTFKKSTGFSDMEIAGEII